MNGEPVVLRVDGVWKKFARSLMRSIRYGGTDIMRDFFGIPQDPDHMRPMEFWATRDVSFEVERGECLGLMGPNGSGKSTLLKLLNGLIVPDKGQLELRGRVGALIEVGAGFHPMLTGRENVYINAAILGLSKSEVDKRFESITDFAELGEFIDTPVKFYSSGMYVRLGFAIAAHVNPDILLIDEVLAVGDVAFRMKCFEYIRRLREAGTTIVIVSHNVNELTRVADRSIVLYKGENIFDGPITEGIGVYQQHLRLPESDKHGHEEGRPYIGEVKLTDEHAIESDKFHTGDTVCAEIDVCSPVPVERMRLIAQIESPTVGMLGAFGSPYSDFYFNVTPPGVRVRLKLYKLPLLLGGYRLNLHLYGPEMQDFYDRVVPAANFQVIAPRINTVGYGVSGLIKFRHEWELTEQNIETGPSPSKESAKR